MSRCWDVANFCPLVVAGVRVVCFWSLPFTVTDGITALFIVFVLLIEAVVRLVQLTVSLRKSCAYSFLLLFTVVTTQS